MSLEKEVELLSRKALWSSFFLTLSTMAISYSASNHYSFAKYRGDGIRGDWRAIGNDIRSAMRKSNEEAKAEA